MTELNHRGAKAAAGMAPADLPLRRLSPIPTPSCLGRSKVATALRLVLLAFGLCWMMGLISAPSVSAQEVAVDPPAGESAARPVSTDRMGFSSRDVSSGPIRFGIGGHYRVGRTTAIALSKDSAQRLETEEIGRYELVMETLDGDGVRVRFGPYPPVRGTAAEEPRELGYVVPGSEAAPIAIRRRGEDVDELLIETRFPLEGPAARGPAMIPSHIPWVLSIGDPLGVEGIGQSNVLLDKTARIAVTPIVDAGDLPYQPLGFDGVDLIMINASGLPVLKELKSQQTQALVEWLREGGRLMVCLGESSKRIQEVAPWLIELLPIGEVEVARYDPAAFETYTASQTPLSVFNGLKLPRRLGQSIFVGRTTRRVTAILAADYVVGFGRITVVAADLDSPMFAEWPERLDLVMQLAGGLFDPSQDGADQRDGSTVFTDMSGQMRGVLDQFSIKPKFGFALLSLIVMVLIAVIGPLDYLLINRFLGKPLLGWVTFPLFVLALSVFLVLQASPTADLQAPGGEGDKLLSSDDPLLRANQFQVVDLDLMDRVGRGFAWSYLYSHEPAEVSANLLPDRWLDSLVTPIGRPKTFSYPMGHPGPTYGGIQIAGENSVLSPYHVKPYLSGKVVREGVGTRIEKVTIAPRSSKSLASRSSFRLSDASLNGEVTRRPGSELLRGELTNPLPFDLLDGVLIYGNWAYTLPTRVPAGATVPSLSELRQKNFRWRLTRQQTKEKSHTETSPWTPNDFSDPVRVAEIMLFHGAAGGSLYTGLSHEPLASLDLSDLLTDDRCILVGRSESPLFAFEVRGSSEDPDAARVPDGNVLSIIRVVMPVRTTRLN